MNSKVAPINSRLAGQLAVVTGGGRGIGCAIAATLSAAGMTTAILARSASEIEETARMIEQSGGRADSLSGRFITIWDDLDSLLGNAKQIEARNLYSLRVQALNGGGVGDTLFAIRADAERPLDSVFQD